MSVDCNCLYACHADSKKDRRKPVITKGDTKAQCVQMNKGCSTQHREPSLLATRKAFFPAAVEVLPSFAKEGRQQQTAERAPLNNDGHI